MFKGQSAYLSTQMKARGTPTITVGLLFSYGAMNGTMGYLGVLE